MSKYMENTNQSAIVTVCVFLGHRFIADQLFPCACC